MHRRKTGKVKKLTPQQKKLWETLLFLAKVLLLSVPLYLIIIFSVSLYPFQQIDASVSSGILRAFGYSVTQNGATIAIEGGNPFTFFLTEDCTAWKSFLFLFALIFAVPKISLKKRLSGLGLGIPILWLGNQARIVGVVLTEQATTVQFAMFTHDYFWRIFLVFLVLGVWLAWMRCPCLRHASLRKRKNRTRLISKKTKRKP